MYDVKKLQKELYPIQPGVNILVVPRMLFIALDGVGDPNVVGGAYQQAVEALYAVAYTLKMSYKTDYVIPGFEPYVVAPLEGLWWLGEGETTVVKSHLRWTCLIRLPHFIRDDDVRWAIETASRKKKQDFSAVRVFDYEEGLVVQSLHLGPYDTESDTLLLMEMNAAMNDFNIDYSSDRTHHEIYLTDPRKTEPEKTKVILRLPLR